MKAVLSGLRASALLILVILLLNPYFLSTKEIQVNPRIALLMDNSESLSVTKGNYNGLSGYREALSQLTETAPRNIEFDEFLFGNSIRPGSGDSLSTTEPSTNLFEALDFILSSEEDYAAALLLSDGIITYGKNPTVRASDSPFPIHAVALGDTSRVKDIAIQNISSSQTGFTNTLHQVEVEIAQFGITEDQVEVSLEHEGETIHSENLSLSQDQTIYTLPFEIELDEVGLSSYTVVVQTVDDEWITDNNRSSFSIDALDSKTRILHFISSIHPDVKALKSILLRDENIDLSSIVYLGSGDPIRDPVDESDQYDLIILHGSPDPDFLDMEVPDWRELPSMYLHLPAAPGSEDNQSYSLISDLSGSGYDISFFSEDRQSDHPVMELIEFQPDRMPPLSGSIRAELEEADASVLLSASYEGFQTNTPVLAVLERGNIRKAHISAYNWYRITQSTNPADRSLITQLFSNIVNWTATDPDNRLLKVSPSRIEFSVAELPIINASLINENGELEEDANVEITLTSGELNSSYTMNNLGSGNYRLQIPSLPAGKYDYTAVASKGSRIIEEQSGEFLVTDSSTELAFTVRNDPLLATLAENSGGRFFTHDSLSGIWQSLSSDYGLESRTEMSESYFFPVRSSLWFILVLILLGSEWYLRKRYALP